MSQILSQEQAISRSLAGEIQMEFFADGEQFPSAREVAERFGVSFCPAQHALKALEKEGLIQLCRGRKTVVLRRPYDNYLKSPVFSSRADALVDLSKALSLISSDIVFQALCNANRTAPDRREGQPERCVRQGKRLYRLFSRDIGTLGSQIVLSLYYDIGAFIESAYLDIFEELYGERKAGRFLEQQVQRYEKSALQCQTGDWKAAKRGLQQVETMFFEEIERYFRQAPKESVENPEAFSWEPHKGRIRFCDDIAIDLICKIQQGMYPLGSYLPRGDVLADIYHVSVITMRRTINLLNKMEVVKTMNGVGTLVVSPGDATIPYKLKDLMIDHNLRAFLEALQFLAITSASVLRFSFPYCTPEQLGAIAAAAAIKEQKASMVATVSACLQAVVRSCPVAAIREIYGKLTLILLSGSVLRLNETGEEAVDGWPQLAGQFIKSLRDRDGDGLADVFEQLCKTNFIRTKETLEHIGVEGAQQVAAPVTLQ